MLGAEFRINTTTESNQIYRSAAGALPGAGERVTDFDPSNDLIALDGISLGSFSFLGVASFAGTVGNTQARFDHLTQTLQIDIGGNNSIDLEITLTDVAASDISASNFVVYSSNLVWCTNGDDILTGAPGDDLVLPHDATADADIIYATEGNDLIDFYTAVNGFYIIDYRGVTGPITAELGPVDGTVTKASGGVDGYRNIDFATAAEGFMFRGTHQDDVITVSLARDDEFVEVRGEGGSDILTGGDGFDRLGYRDAPSGVTINVALGVASVNVDLAAGTATGLWDGQGFTDTLTSIESIRGSRGDDMLTGDGLSNRLDGRNGNDTINGGGGSDTLIGGAGADRFVFDAPGDGIDVIVDFTPGVDILVISASAFGGGLLVGEGLNTDQFVLGDAPAATEPHGQFLYDTATGTLGWDADGTGAGATVQTAVLNGAPGISVVDFELV